MGIRSSPGWHPYDASDRKTFKSALCYLLHTEFPGIFGPTISRLFADKIDELYERFHPPRSRFKSGQVLWTGVAIDDPPSRNKRIEDTPARPDRPRPGTQPKTSTRPKTRCCGREPASPKSSASSVRPL